MKKWLVYFELLRLLMADGLQYFGFKWTLMIFLGTGFLVFLHLTIK